MTIKLKLLLPYAGKLAGDTYEVDTDAEAVALTNLKLAEPANVTAEKRVEKAAQE
jgi:hypothetical protein